MKWVRVFYKFNLCFMDDAVRDVVAVKFYYRFLLDQYGVGGGFVGVPCVLGAGGMEKVIEIDLDADEKKLMDESISHVKDLVGTVKTTFPDLA